MVCCPPRKNVFAAMAFWRKRKTSSESAVQEDSQSVLSDGSLKYVAQKGGNGSLPSYQEASGAPVETRSPLGYEVGPITIVFLNLSKMIGTGVYTTRKYYPTPNTFWVC